MFRYFVAFCAVCLGGITAVADVAISMPMIPPQLRGIPGNRSPEEERILFEACITFYGVVYTTGWLLYRGSGAQLEAEELRVWSRWHLAILNLAGGFWLLISGALALQQAVLRPSLVVGMILVALTIYNSWRDWRAKRGKIIRQS